MWDVQKQRGTIAKDTREIENDRKIIENIARGGEAGTRRGDQSEARIECQISMREIV